MKTKKEEEEEVRNCCVFYGILFPLSNGKSLNKQQKSDSCSINTMSTDETVEESDKKQGKNSIFFLNVT